MSLNFCFIGAGNLATQLSQALKNKGYEINQVYSRSEKSGKKLAETLSTRFVTSAKEITKDAGIYFVALKDSAFEEVLSQIDFDNKLVVHCSGSLPLSVLRSYSENTGVLYPLQTFSKDRKVEFRKIPLFVESGNESNLKLLLKIAGEISDSVSVADSEKRKMLHISAVFACNFVNYFYTIASDILKSGNIQFEVLKPLILETALKVQEIEPEKAQTGPAVRFDKNIIDSHLKFLDENSEYGQLYRLISKHIFERYKK